MCRKRELLLFNSFTLKKGCSRNVCDFSQDDTLTADFSALSLLNFIFFLNFITFLSSCVLFKQGSNVVVAANSQGTIKVMISVLKLIFVHYLCL